MQHVKDVFSVALKMRRDLHLTKTKAHVYIQPCNADVEEALLKHHTAFLVLSRSAEVHILSERSFPPNGCIYDSTEQGNVVYMQVQDLINVEEELNKLEKQREKQNVALHKISVKSSQDAQFSIEEEKVVIFCYINLSSTLSGNLSAKQGLSNPFIEELYGFKFSLPCCKFQ
ncbi:hypothetical protein CAPTEDRAFT_192839 [Capitella teleta]|uniref:Uncharacterized protein n=1 Tax=Capitella teleta TaxID=283909 RepID=R7UN51_CAPTE|nr:hypothetical protein CAPTEDRAFT_192839 [Capitella teleta]|eukprot:ELU05372.1 hypothetical protein CAPTEDRAFT_192839 [Capitella teleta]